MKELGNARATLLEVGEDGEAQRIDNFLLRRLKGVPKSHVYRVLRSGEVRVNSGRVKPQYRLRAGDRVRVPPLRLAAPARRTPPARPLELPVVHEDAALLVLDKPSGIAVHGGSGISHGAIEALRAARPQAKVLELAHRLDRDTSGLLLVAKKRSALLELHRMLREGEIEKRYVAAVLGRWQGGERELNAALHKYVTASGERRVSVSAEGRNAVTRVRPLAVSERCSLLELTLLTGRTHQIRVHLAHAGHPVLGDDKYGDFEANRAFAREGVARLMLHAQRLSFRHPATGSRLRLEAPWPEALRNFVHRHWPEHAR
ncbi:MAG: RluA family pseudouridine synthase [Betaproteobacteria bacterium]|nr:MAG: RluA family pseudouridine synthase [Betaproteobacteria bacterium]